ncbi:hypothetical protein Dimus_037248, partial [Dionaea muscipula]
DSSQSLDASDGSRVPEKQIPAAGEVGIEVGSKSKGGLCCDAELWRDASAVSGEGIEKFAVVDAPLLTSPGLDSARFVDVVKRGDAVVLEHRSMVDNRDCENGTPLSYEDHVGEELVFSEEDVADELAYWKDAIIGEPAERVKRQWQPIQDKRVQQARGDPSSSLNCEVMVDSGLVVGDRVGSVDNEEHEWTPARSRASGKAVAGPGDCELLTAQRFEVLEEDREDGLECDRGRTDMSNVPYDRGRMASLNRWLEMSGLSFTDRNSKYFYNLLQARRRKARICYVLASDGVLASSNLEIGAAFISFFTELMGMPFLPSEQIKDEERNLRVFRGQFSAPNTVAREALSFVDGLSVQALSEDIPPRSRLNGRAVTASDRAQKATRRLHARSPAEEGSGLRARSPAEDGLRARSAAEEGSGLRARLPAEDGLRARLPAEGGSGLRARHLRACLLASSSSPSSSPRLVDLHHHAFARRDSRENLTMLIGSSPPCRSSPEEESCLMPVGLRSSPSEEAEEKPRGLLTTPISIH